MIYLQENPWSPRYQHRTDAGSLREWRQFIASINSDRRYSVSMSLTNDARPDPVQRFHGVDWPRDVLSSDGFLVVRCGLLHIGLAEMQWRCISEFPEHLRAYDRFIGGSIRDMSRHATTPPKPQLRLIHDN